MLDAVLELLIACSTARHSWRGFQLARMGYGHKPADSGSRPTEAAKTTDRPFAPRFDKPGPDLIADRLGRPGSLGSNRGP